MQELWAPNWEERGGGLLIKLWDWSEGQGDSVYVLFPQISEQRAEQKVPPGALL